jgi:hypothetical protein
MVGISAHVGTGAPTPEGRMHAYWVTLLVYVLAGPIVGLLSMVFIAFLGAAWGVLTDQLAVLMPHAQSSSCAYSGYIDLRCFQRGPELRHFVFPSLNFLRIPLYVLFAYVIGLIPALMAAALICWRGLRHGTVSFGYAIMVGTLIGLMMGGVLGISKPGNAWFFPICLIATIVCWLITRRWWRRAEIADTNSAG